MDLSAPHEKIIASTHFSFHLPYYPFFSKLTFEEMSRFRDEYASPYRAVNQPTRPRSYAFPDQNFFRYTAGPKLLEPASIYDLQPPQVTSFVLRAKSREARSVTPRVRIVTERPRSVLWEDYGPPPSRSSGAGEYFYSDVATERTREVAFKGRFEREKFNKGRVGDLEDSRIEEWQEPERRRMNEARRNDEARQRDEARRMIDEIKRKQREKLREDDEEGKREEKQAQDIEELRAQEKRERLKAENEIRRFKRRLVENSKTDDSARKLEMSSRSGEGSKELSSNEVNDNYISTFADIAETVSRYPRPKESRIFSGSEEAEKDIFPERASQKPPVYNYPTPTLDAIEEEPESTDKINQGLESKSSPTAVTLELDPSTNMKPTCMLNLVCYRSGMQGCELHQIYVANRNRYKLKRDFSKAIRDNPELITDDRAFFHALRDVYLHKMCGIRRRMFFLKTLRGIRLLSVSFVVFFD